MGGQASVCPWMEPTADAGAARAMPWLPSIPQPLASQEQTGKSCPHSMSPTGEWRCPSYPPTHPLDCVLLKQTPCPMEEMESLQPDSHLPTLRKSPKHPSLWGPPGPAAPGACLGRAFLFANKSPRGWPRQGALWGGPSRHSHDS